MDSVVASDWLIHWGDDTSKITCCCLGARFSDQRERWPIIWAVSKFACLLCGASVAVFHSVALKRAKNSVAKSQRFTRRVLGTLEWCTGKERYPHSQMPVQRITCDLPFAFLGPDCCLLRLWAASVRYQPSQCVWCLEGDSIWFGHRSG